MRIHVSERVRHIVLRADGGEWLPDALVDELQRQSVNCGWLRASGVLRDVELRALDPALGAQTAARRLAGPLQVVVLEGSIGVYRGELSIGLRAVLAREGELGLETFAGELIGARVVGIEALVTCFDDVTLVRALDPRAGMWLLGNASASGQAPSTAPTVPKPEGAPLVPKDPAVAGAWGEAIAASAEADQRAERTLPRASPSPSAGGPLRRPRRIDDMQTADTTPLPEAGDVVEHHAWGRCDVLKSDGERLHLKVHKDGRIKEISLAMLKVTLLSEEGTKKRFRLDRRM